MNTFGKWEGGTLYMSTYATFTQGNQGDSRLLVVES